MRSLEIEERQLYIASIVSVKTKKNKGNNRVLALILTLFLFFELFYLSRVAIPMIQLGELIRGFSIFFLALVITLGAIYLYYTSYTKLKSNSEEYKKYFLDVLQNYTWFELHGEISELKDFTFQEVESEYTIILSDKMRAVHIVYER